jgi:hypothetical protein
MSRIAIRSFRSERALPFPPYFATIICYSVNVLITSRGWLGVRRMSGAKNDASTSIEKAVWSFADYKYESATKLLKDAAEKQKDAKASKKRT